MPCAERWLRADGRASRYHTDNVDVRVHKVRENARAIVTIGVGLQLERRRPGESPLRDIRRAQSNRRFDGLAETLAAFERDPLVETAIEARHAFVHRYRDEQAIGFSARERYSWAPSPKDDALAEAVRTLNETGIDLYIGEQAARLTSTIAPIRALRRALFNASARAALGLASADAAKLKDSIDPFGNLV